MKVLFISSYVPRKCGIATFCRDLIEGVKRSNPKLEVDVAAMVDEASSSLTYPKEVAYVIRQELWEDYLSLIQIINFTNKYDLICVQHEFGIYGGDLGEYIARFLEDINKPVITTLHTVLPKPTKLRKEIIQRVCGNSKKVVVMLKNGQKILNEVYGVPNYKVEVIHHGVPEFNLGDPKDVKKQLKLDDKVVMSSVNLLSPVKGVEYAIRALPEITKVVPNFVYQVIGETHPSEIRNNEGEDVLRKRLMRLAKKLGVEKNIRFINEYVSVPDLVKYVTASDFYITPYLDPQQSSSGALSYAIGGGKICISTPYLYAKEMLKKGAGILVPFRNSRAIAKSVVQAIKDEKVRRAMESKTKVIGKNMTWVSVGKQYDRLFT